MKEFLNNVFWCVLKGAVFGAFCTICYAVVVNTFVAGSRRMKAFAPYNPLKGEKRTPVKPPHSVVAEQFKVRHGQGFEVTQSLYVYYHYEVDGKEYTYVQNYVCYPEDDKITLYYRKSPSKARPSTTYGGVENDWIPVFLISSAAGVLINFLILGGEIFWNALSKL